MNKPDIRKIVWDLDNTPWDWVKGAAKIYPAMQHTLARETGLSREQIMECMRNFYGRAGTLESSWLVQDLDKQGLFNGLDIDRDHLIAQVRKSFHMNRQKHLTMFDGFPEIFQQALNNKVENVIRTDAPACHAASRLRHFNLDKGYFSHMIAMRDSLPDEVPETFHTKYQRGQYGLPFPVTLMDCEKPGGDITDVLAMSEEEIGKHVAFIGDNYPKDMGQAARYGSLGIYAGWGRASKEYLDIIAEYSGRNIANRNAPMKSQEESFPNIVVANHPNEIPQILEWR